MTKYSFLVYHKEYDRFLTDIRELGVLHVIQKQAGMPEEGSELQDNLQEAARFEKALKYISSHLVGNYDNCLPVRENGDAPGMVAHLEVLLENRSRAQQRQLLLDKEIERMELWGDFEWENIYRLKDVGYIVRFWSTAERNFTPALEEQYNAIRVHADGSQMFFITITPRGEVVEMENAERVRLPKETLSELLGQRSESRQEELELGREIEEHCKACYWSIEAGYRRILEAIDYNRVVLNTEGKADNKLFLLEGWVPTENESNVNAFLASEGIYYESERAGKEDPAPVKLKNNWFARLFHPITELYDMPSYGEMDLTPFFAPFFVMFFGLCLGDAGYGLLLVLIGLIARAKVKPALKPMMTLVTILGIGTVIFGTISGTLFGIQLLDVDWPWIQKMKKFMLSSNDLFYFSLIVGVLQIIFGMTLKAIGQTVRFGFRNALAAWGWLILIVGCGAGFALKKAGLVSAQTSDIIIYASAGVGSVGIFILNNIRRNPIINIGAGLWDSYNMASGLLGDILSYVRLFALGISGSVLGLVFNDLAVKMSPDVPVVGFLITAIILLFGHGMNIFMSGLGAFVHPMRLTFVEFYKNAGFEGGGKKYAPFARKVKED